MSFATLRQDVADALANPTKWNVYAYPPMTVTANSIIIQPNDPYVEINNGAQPVPPLVNFKLSFQVPLLDNQGSLNELETFMQEAFLLLSTSNLVFRWGTFTAPNELPTQAGQMLSSDLNLSIISSWE